MSYCWEIYKKSECTCCFYFKAFHSGEASLESLKNIILVNPKEIEEAKKAQEN